MSAPDAASPSRKQAAHGDQALAAGSTPPTGTPESSTRPFAERASDAAGVYMGNYILGVGKGMAGMARGAISTARAAETPVGAVLGLAVGAVGGGVAASLNAGAHAVREGAAAFREGADARIQAMREPSETPVNSGEPAASNQPEDKA